jgi:hypothetical protein
MGIAIAFIGVLVALAAGPACRAATEITIEISTDVKCSDVRGTAITVGDLSTLDAKPATTVTPACDPRTGRIGSMVIVPSGANDDVVAMKVVLGIGRNVAECVPPAYGPGCIVARRALRFIPSSSLYVPIFMAAVCSGIPCEATTTCRGGSCASAIIEDPSVCSEPGGCTESSLGPSLPPRDDAGGAPDAIAFEASIVPDGCVGAACIPVALVSGVQMPSAIATAGGSIFFTTEHAGGSVMQCPASGCAAPTTLRAGLDNPDVVAADATHVYWGYNQSGLVQCTWPNCASPINVYTDTPGGLAVTNSGVYFTARYNAYVGVWTKPSGPFGVLGLAGGNAYATVADNTAIYFTSDFGGGVYRCPLTGSCSGGPRVPVPPNVIVRALALDATHVYWTEPESGRVMRAPKDSLSPLEVIAFDADRPAGIGVDASSVYWTERRSGGTDGRLRWRRKAGGPLGLLAVNQSNPTGLVVAGSRVFWTNKVSAGAVMSVPGR